MGITFSSPLPGIPPSILSPGNAHDWTGKGVMSTTTGLASPTPAYITPVPFAPNARRPVITTTTTPGTGPLPALLVTRFLAFKTTLEK